MDVRPEAEDDLVIRFRTVRLPRAIDVDYPFSNENLLSMWRVPRAFLVAAVESVILGYVHLTVQESENAACIQHLVVHRPMRRHHIGSALLEQAHRWSLLHDLTHLTLAVQTKNYPAMCFARKHGFVFCGFNDHYYPNQDIAVLFGKGI